MDDRPTLQQQVDWLYHGEVMPVLLAIDTSYREDFQVHIVLLDPSEAGPNGFTSAPPIMTRHYADPPGSIEVERTRRREAPVTFADQLRELLA